VANSTKQALEKINEVSRQLLSRILDVQNSIQEKPQIQDEPIANETIPNKQVNNEQITAQELTELMSERQSLISRLFEKKSTEEISLELNLLNEMVSLDNELSNKSQGCKQVLAEQVLKLKNSNKVKKSYQKY